MANLKIQKVDLGHFLHFTTSNTVFAPKYIPLFC